MLRNLYRKLLDHELGVLGGELEKLQAKNEQLGVQLSAFGERFELVIKRSYARIARNARSAESIAPEDQRILDELGVQLRGGNGTRRHAENEEW